MMRSMKRMACILCVVMHAGVDQTMGQDVAQGWDDIDALIRGLGDLPQPEQPAVAPAADPAVEAAPATDVEQPVPVPAVAVEPPVVEDVAQEWGDIDALIRGLGDVPQPEQPAAAPAADQAVEAVPAVAVEPVPAPAAEEPPVPVPAVAAEPPVEDVAQEWGDVGALIGDLGNVPQPSLPASPRDTLVSELMTLEALRRKALDEHGMASLKAAKRSLRDGNYEEAKSQFELALTYIGDRMETRPLRDEAREGVREALYRQAILLWRREDRERAVQLARQALEKGHPQASKLSAAIQEEIDTPPEPKKPVEIARMHEKSYRDEREEIQRRIRRARHFYVVGEYDKARGEAEIVLRDHPFNTEAMDLIDRIGDETYDVSSTELEATRSRMIRDVRDTWTPRRYALDIARDLDRRQDTPAPVRLVGGTGMTAEQIVVQKMKDIVIPEITFRNANINDVITFFQSASREYDAPDTPPEKRGVNFVLKQHARADPAGAAAVQDPFAVAAGAGDAAFGGGAPITVTMRFVSLLDALKMVTDVAGMKYRVRGNIVVIMPVGMPDDDIVTRSYNVLPTLTERIVGASREIGRGAGRGEDSGFMMPTPADTTEKQDWKEFFRQMGVNWPDGSAISYMATIGRLRVSNTPENLAVFEQVLEELNVTPRQIEIEARFVEVAQEDLDSLGFQWSLDGNVHIGRGTVGPDGKAGLILDGGGNTAASTRDMTKGLRFLSQQGLAGIGSAVDDGIVRVTSALDGNQLSMVLHALSQQSNTDLLSAPKVVTKSGQEAVMKVVSEYIYPTEFTVIALRAADATGGTTTTGAAVEPGGFETREVGVILQVIPEVSAEGQMINLIMNPQVVTEPTWKDYGYDMPNPVPGGPPLRLPMEQPFFKVRSISTSVSIYNGATVVMGGMITEARRARHDKVPLLGDIPYIGRFFRSTAELSEKRNLLIFVTARLVDPAGRVIRTSDELGL